MLLPTGIVTFLFTDIEGSTRLWEAYPAAMRVVLARHDALLRERIEANNGVVFKTVGDAFCAAFSDAGDAVTAAFAIQDALCRETWDASLALRVRTALHSGEAEQRDGDYFGLSVNRVARLLAIAHGGQIVLSSSTAQLAAEALPDLAFFRELGFHRLRDLQQPEFVSQFCHPDIPDDFPPLKSLKDTQHNLPVQVTHFVGRETDIENTKALLAKSRLLTLTGAGGMGKTRLSLQVAADLIDANEDGVWLIELAPVSDPALVVKAVASVLDVPEEAGRPLIVTLTEALKTKKILLVLDNCEHVLDGAAALAIGLIKACPQVRILSSSREALGVTGEQVYQIPSLSLPRLTASGDDPHELQGSEAFRLFSDRASLVNANFAVSAANEPAVRRLCIRLDGIPLALELAAARVRSMPVEQIESRLDDRFRLLTGGDRAALPRQKTLRALIDWSYDLLNGGEKRLLQRLSLFAGGWTVDAAESVCAGDDLDRWEILEILSALVDKNLVLYECQETRSRYRLLETIRQYALEKLVETGTAWAFQVSHRDFYLAVAESMIVELFSPTPEFGFLTLETEHENLRVAIAFCLIDPEGAQAGLRIGAALAEFWWIRGYLTEGREHLRALLARDGADAPTRSRAHALNCLVAIAWLQGDITHAHERIEESLSISRAGGDTLGTAISIGYLGNLDYERGDYAVARTHLEESLAGLRELGLRHFIPLPLTFLGHVARCLGDRDSARSWFEESLAVSRSENALWWVVLALSGLGLLAQDAQDYASAQTLLEDSLRTCRELRDSRSRSYALANLGQLMCFTGDYEAGERYLSECLQVCRQLGNRPEAAAAIEAHAHLAELRDRPERAARLCGAVEALRVDIARPRVPPDQARYDQLLARLSKKLGRDAFTRARNRGEAMSYEAALTFALEDT